MPPLPPGTTALVLNWHWSCSAAAPPSTAAPAVTVCVGCNIAIAIRIASPGDSGSVAQTIGSTAAAIAENAAAAAQGAAAVALPPAPSATAPVPPAVPLVSPAPPAAVGAVIGSQPATVGTATLPATAAGASAAGSPGRELSDDAPRHGAPEAFRLAQASGMHRPLAAVAGAAHVWPPSGPRALVAAATLTGPPTIEAGRPAAAASGASPRPRTFAPPVPSPVAPPAPTPIVLAPLAGSVHAAGSVTNGALAAGVFGLFLLIVSAYATPGLQTARSRFAHVHPDPPG